MESGNISTLIWKSVKKDGLPEVDREKVFIGINKVGFCCCFNGYNNHN